MSKLYKKYIMLKIKDSNKVYLFKCGIFYLFIDEDAKLMSNYLNLKLTNLNNVIVKCGFPINSAEKYFSILNSSNYSIEVVLPDTNIASPISVSDYISAKKFKNVVDDFLAINLNNISISKAFEVLNELQNKFKEIF